MCLFKASEELQGQQMQRKDEDDEALKRRKRSVQQSSLRPRLPLTRPCCQVAFPSMQTPFSCCSSGTLRNENVFVASGILKVRARVGKPGFDSCRQAG